MLQTKLCHNKHAQLEEDEFFTVFLQSSDQQLTLNPSTATIEINSDEDGT